MKLNNIIKHSLFIIWLATNISNATENIKEKCHIITYGLSDCQKSEKKRN